jgi:hypothetical protein
MEAAQLAPPRPAANGGTVAQVMLRRPVVHGVAMTVGEARAFFLDDHVHMLLVVDGRRLVAAVERGDLVAARHDDACVRLFGSLGGRTVPPYARGVDVFAAMCRSGRRRLAVTDDNGALVGLLCLKANGRGFCSDADVEGRVAAA